MLELVKCSYLGGTKRSLTTFSPKNILIERTDNIGDVVLSVPTADAIKRKFPGCRIVFIMRKYTEGLGKFFTNVDDVILYEDLLDLGTKKATAYLQEQQFDCFISLNSKRALLQLIKAARIPVRIANSRVWYNWLYYNVLPNVTRSKSALHEAQLNLRVATPLGVVVPDTLQKIIPQTTLVPHPQSGIEELDTPDARFKLVLHPASNKSGREWPEEYYVSLIKDLDPAEFQIFITGSLHEKERLQQLCTISQENVCNIMGRLSIAEWHDFLQQVDGLVAAGTGPLHLAAAMGVRTLGLFPRKKEVSVGRWQPLGENASYLMYPNKCAIEKCSNCSCACMRAISVGQVKKIILDWGNEI